MKHGINTSIHYPTPIHLQDVSKYLGYKKEIFLSQKNKVKILTLPVNNNLTSNQINYICEKINKFYK